MAHRCDARWYTVITGFVVLTAPGTAWAQNHPAPSGVWRHSGLEISESNPELVRIMREVPDPRAEAAAIGASIGAVSFAVIGAAVCAGSDSTHCGRVALGSGLLGALVGGITGRLLSAGRDQGASAE